VEEAKKQLEEVQKKLREVQNLEQETGVSLPSIRREAQEARYRNFIRILRALTNKKN